MGHRLRLHGEHARVCLPGNGLFVNLLSSAPTEGGSRRRVGRGVGGFRLGRDGEGGRREGRGMEQGGRKGHERHTGRSANPGTD